METDKADVSLVYMARDKPVCTMSPAMKEMESTWGDTRRLISASHEAVTKSFESMDRTRELVRRTRKLLGMTEGNEMDPTRAQDHLAEAERHIAEGEQHVRHQRKIIADLERGGHDTALANELLETLETTLARHVAWRERLAEELRQESARRSRK